MFKFNFAFRSARLVTLQHNSIVFDDNSIAGGNKIKLQGYKPCRAITSVIQLFGQSLEA
ncbi:hypothetical protein [Pinibacter soli]|uniref:Uncharacterized protein n=1 Tax=Pinibacter soli TaxID=3044211 RepID=A0ABT6R8F8_9BACT|nr:hypothetical protein [Pinibacter soli]MDI3318835.1 hypothetical protein [Pinibacter soli]